MIVSIKFIFVWGSILLESNYQIKYFASQYFKTKCRFRYLTKKVALTLEAYVEKFNFAIMLFLFEIIMKIELVRKIKLIYQ